MNGFKVNKNISEGLIHIDNAEVVIPKSKSINWNPNEYKIKSINTEKGEIVLKALENDEG